MGRGRLLTPRVTPRLHSSVLGRSPPLVQYMTRIFASVRRPWVTSSTLATGNEDAKVLMVVQPNERNVFDQRLIAAELWEKHGAGSLVRSRSTPLT